MAKFYDAVLTDAGADLMSRSMTENFTVEFVKLVIGCGEYEGEEKTKEALRRRTELKELRMEKGFVSVLATGQQAVLLKALITNDGLDSGYRMTEIGIIAKKRGDTESGGILYSVAVAEQADYLPESVYPVSFTQEYYTRVCNAESVTINVEVGEFALAEDMHRVMYPEYETAEERTELKSGESVFKIFGKIARWFADLKAIAFSGSYRDLSDKPALGSAASQVVVNNDTTSLEGYVADARVVKVHGDEIDSLNTALEGHKTSGDHDGRYYTEAEIDTKLAGKSATGHVHDDRYYTEAEVNTMLAGKSGTGHTHDERYYTEAEVNTMLAGKLPTTASCNRNWNWSGQAGQPTWMWGGNDAANMYVYNPSNFRVSYATSAGTATSAGGCTGNAASASCVYTYIVSNKNSAGDRYRIALTSEGNFRPDGLVGTSGNLVVGDSKFNLGISSNRWKQLYAATATISTSDRNLKKEIKPLTDKYLKFFMRLQPVSFLFRDGESGRAHIGFIAQDVEAAMAECGLTALDFAGFCRDVRTICSIVGEKEIEEPVLDSDGNPEYIYSLRYEEFIALNTCMIQTVMDRADRLEERMDRMECMLAERQEDP